MADGPDSRDDLVARAAWLHFVGGMTHAEVGRQLHVPGFKVQRLIASATRDGVVQIFVNSKIGECVRLERELCERYGLQECVVAPDLGRQADPMHSLAVAGAQTLLHILQGGTHRVIGLGHGRTLTAIVENLPRCHCPETKFVALLGGLTTSFSADPYDVIHRIADRTGTSGYFMPVPFFANSIEDRAVLMAQLGVTKVQDLARTATMFLIGIGTASKDGFLAQCNAIGETDLKELERLGACGEILGYFHDRDGTQVETSLSRRTVALAYDDLRQRHIVAAAGGEDKTAAIRAILKSGLLSGLITDETTAQALCREQRQSSAQSRTQGLAQGLVQRAEQNSGSSSTGLRKAKRRRTVAASG